MKFYSIVFAFLSGMALVNCGNDKTAEKVEIETVSEKPLASELDTFYLGGKLVHVEKIEKSAFDEVDAAPAVDTSEVKNIQNDSDKVQRMGDTLRIKTTAKDVFIVNNDSDTDEYAHYTYQSYIKNIDQYLVFGGFYEWHNYLLIDGKTGAQTVLWGSPVVSPNGEYIVSGNADLVAQFTDNGIQLFANAGAPKIIGERILQLWGPEEIRWSDNKTLFVKANVADDKSPDMEVTRYFKLKLGL